MLIRRYVLTEFSQNFAVLGDLLYALGVLRQSSVGLVEAMGEAGVSGGG